MHRDEVGELLVQVADEAVRLLHDRQQVLLRDWPSAPAEGRRLVSTILFLFDYSLGRLAELARRHVGQHDALRVVHLKFGDE